MKSSDFTAKGTPLSEYVMSPLTVIGRKSWNHKAATGSLYKLHRRLV